MAEDRYYSYRESQRRESIVREGEEKDGRDRMCWR